jgi:hypothetical protein
MRNKTAEDALFETTAILTALLAGTAFAMLVRDVIAAIVPLLEFIVFSRLPMMTGL